MATTKIEINDREVVMLKAALSAHLRSIQVMRSRNKIPLVQQGLDKEALDVHAFMSKFLTT